MKHWHDAARLYEAGEQMDKAVAIYIRTKNWSAASPLMGRITSPKLHAEYAKAKEAEGNYEEAETAYERAQDMDSVVRLLLNHLGKPQRAYTIVRETKSSQGAMLVAKHCQARRPTPLTPPPPCPPTPRRAALPPPPPPSPGPRTHCRPTPIIQPSHALPGAPPYC